MLGGDDKDKDLWGGKIGSKEDEKGGRQGEEKVGKGKENILVS